MCESLVAAEFLLSICPFYYMSAVVLLRWPETVPLLLGALEIAFEFLVVPSEKVPCSWAQRKGTTFQVPLKPPLWALFSADMSFSNQIVRLPSREGWGSWRSRMICADLEHETPAS